MNEKKNIQEKQDKKKTFGRKKSFLFSETNSVAHVLCYLATEARNVILYRVGNPFTHIHIIYIYLCMSKTCKRNINEQ